MSLNSSDIKFLKQLNVGKTPISNITNLNITQIKYKLKKINYLLFLLNLPDFYLSGSRYINSKKKSLDFLLTNFDGLIYSKEERLNHIVTMFLKNKYIHKKEIPEILQCSKSTIKNDFIDLKNLLKDFQISLKYIHRFGFTLDGNEKKIRDFFLNYYMKNFDFFKKIVFLKKIKLLVFDILKGQNSSFETSKIISILLSIQYYRILQERYINYTPLKQTAFFNKCSKSDYSYLNLIIKNNSNLKVENIYFEFYLNNLIYNNTHHPILHEHTFSSSINIFIKNVADALNLNLTDDLKLKEGLSNHIYALLFKKDNSIPTNNEDLDSFKKEFYSLYKTIYNQSKIFSSNFKVHFDNGDLLYISYHFLSAINRSNKEKTKKVLIVCNKGRGAAKILEEKLKLLFFIEVVDNLSFYEYQTYDIKNTDFIIHTINNLKSNIKNIKVAPFISKADEISIENLGCFKK